MLLEMMLTTVYVVCRVFTCSIGQLSNACILHATNRQQSTNSLDTYTTQSCFRRALDDGTRKVCVVLIAALRVVLGGTTVLTQVPVF